MARRAFLFTITGRVQGVGYRAAAQRKAEELGVTGTVRNLRDGRVQMHAEGDPEALAALQAWCQRGPTAASVLQVEVGSTEVTGYDRFDVVG